MTDVLVVGGGPAGLLLSKGLREQGIGHRVVERGRAGQTWRSMRPGMPLLSPSVPGTDWTSLDLARPLWAMPGARRPFPTRDDFLCYLEAFAREEKVRVEENTAVLSAAAVPGGTFRVASSSGEIVCRFIVVATGATTAPAWPDIPGISGNPRVIHSGDFINCRSYIGQKVLVIGGGNSAAETVLELAGTADVVMSTRSPLSYFSLTGELEDIRGASESVLKECIRFGIVKVREADPPVSVSGGAVSFRGGDTEQFDWIICATGYKPSWFPVSGATIAVRSDGFPVISRAGESSVPGLYFCGSLARFHRRCAFIHGFRGYVEKVLWDLVDRV